MEHWGNAVAQAEVAARNMVSCGPRRYPHLTVPAFWSILFGLNIESIGVPTFLGPCGIAQGSLESGRPVAVYGYRGRITAAVTVNIVKWLEHYECLIEERLIETAAPLPLEPGLAGRPVAAAVRVPSGVPDPKPLRLPPPRHGHPYRRQRRVLTAP
ncbi:hypothetical protein [Streptomyces sp. NPDC057557]|uniref:hypothetical protein n=1 Tax=Streptomyces sp. NPDC057557 TaxID=3346167 RepID=UPI0036B77B7B